MGDRQEAFEDYRNLCSHRDDLLRQCAELKRAYDAILDDCRIQEEHIKVLEEAVKDWHKVEDQRSEEIIKQSERIKVLEDALKFYQYVENYKSTAPVARGDGSYDYDVPVLIDNGEIARKALEVKPCVK
jgi:hypothetical protein